MTIFHDNNYHFYHCLFIFILLGNLTSVIHRFPYSAINFAVYDRLRNYFRKKNYTESPFTRFLCGASAGGIACFACYPLDLVRTKLTVLGGHGGHVYGGISKTIYSIVKSEGILGLYRGVLISVCVTTPTFGISFCVYGTVKEKILNLRSRFNILKDNQKLSAYGCMFCGAISGTTSSLIMFPADSLRRRMQVSGFLLNPDLSNKNSQNIKNTIETSKKNSIVILKEILLTFKGDGYKGLYRGIIPELLKVIPMVSITFGIYEFTYDLLNA
jgi:solute carrier family 25 phosphate transporter 23/24/25/41